MDGLPFIPGNSFKDPTLVAHHKSHSLGYRNGYQTARPPSVGIGGRPIHHNQVSEADLEELNNFRPSVTYPQETAKPPPQFLPAHILWDKKVLKFEAWFSEEIHNSPLEKYRVRFVNIFFHLEDGSVAVVEPNIENSGLSQGKIIKRQRIPKNDAGDFYRWKDLNVGINITFYGITYRTYNCDGWTREFMESEGLEVNPPEECPVDPHTMKRNAPSSATIAASKEISNEDKLAKFMELDRKVLRFNALWDDRENMFGECRKFIIHFYLVDGTVEIREQHDKNDGRDPFPVLIGRHRIPKDRDDLDGTFPTIILEPKSNDIKEFFEPEDFVIGQCVKIYNRKFLLYDCDNFTKGFFYKNFGVTEFHTVDIDSVTRPQYHKPKQVLPHHSGYGSIEDSLQSVKSLIPKPPPKDYTKMLENEGKILRFEATKMGDDHQRFIISYRLADDTITIHSLAGGKSLKFLERSRVTKPGCNPADPIYYGPQDFYIGADVEVYKHRFSITNADLYVLNYMEQHPNQFPVEVINKLREKFGQEPK